MQTLHSNSETMYIHSLNDVFYTTFTYFDI